MEPPKEKKKTLEIEPISPIKVIPPVIDTSFREKWVSSKNPPRTSRLNSASTILRTSSLAW
jgi:hypothetical protein